MSGFSDPVCQVPHKVEEEITIRHTDDLKQNTDSHSEKFDDVHVNLQKNGT